MEESTKSRNLNRHKNKQCKACNQIISGAHWTRHCARKHNNISQAYEFTDQKATTPDPFNPTGMMSANSFEIGKVIMETPALLKQMKEDLLAQITAGQKRFHPEEEEKEEKDEEEKKLTKDQQKRYDQYIGVFKNNVAAAFFLATRNIEESTRKIYMSFLKSFFKLEGTISQEAINDFFTLHRDRDELSPDTLAGIKKVLKAICSSTPPLSSIVFGKLKERTRKRKKEDLYLPTKTEVENLIANLKNEERTKTLGLFLEVMFVTAMRPVDVVFLKAADLHKKGNDFFINVMEKKTHKSKQTMIPERLYEQAIALTKAKGDRVFDFIPEKNYCKTLSRIFQKHCIINGVAILPKAIRKASITHAYKGGLEAAALLGSHSNPATTINHYIDPKETDKQRWLRNEPKKEEKKDLKKEDSKEGHKEITFKHT